MHKINTIPKEELRYVVGRKKDFFCNKVQKTLNTSRHLRKDVQGLCALLKILGMNEMLNQKC